MNPELIQTVVLLCISFTGQGALDCRIHVRSCVDSKRASMVRLLEKDKNDCIKKSRSDAQLCDGRIKVANPEYCQDLFHYQTTCIGTVDFSMIQKDWILECAKKQGLM